jgi:hypothetical protein
MDGTLRILDWLANNFTKTMLKRWMIIWFMMVVIGVLAIIP